MRRSRQQYTKELRQRAKQGICGYRVASIAYFGPDDQVATKVAVSILPDETLKPSATERWQSLISDLRDDEGVNEEILSFIDEQGAKTVLWERKIIGCTHEEGPGNCPACSFWVRRRAANAE